MAPVSSRAPGRPFVIDTKREENAIKEAQAPRHPGGRPASTPTPIPT
ncbi:MAG: hypothetical protein ACLTSX_00145 [Collinsella sp.]